jgi:hypothetical protein
MSARKAFSVSFAFTIAAVAMLAAVTGSAGAHSAASGPAIATASSTACDLTPHEQRHLGASYVTSLKVSHVSCKRGKEVTKDFNDCRTAGGKPQGKCNHDVDGFSCDEHRFDAVPHVQYNSRVTCTRGAKVVKSTYTQNV